VKDVQQIFTSWLAFRTSSDRRSLRLHLNFESSAYSSESSPHHSKGIPVATMPYQRGPAHRFNDYIPQSIVDSPRYGLQIATFASTRFVDFPTAERRARVPVARTQAASPLAENGVAIALTALTLLVGLVWCVPLFISP
jgi:hypothetical protein